MPQTRQNRKQLDLQVNHYEDLPQPVIAFTRELPAGSILPFHKHRRAQLVYASHGVMSVTTETGAYVVPPQRAVWMPPGVLHQTEARSDVYMQSLFIEGIETTELPGEVCVLQVTPLLRELIMTVSAGHTEYSPNSPESRIMAVILDQIKTQPIASLALPMPTDSRVARITQALLQHPADQRRLDQWASEVGASKRTLTRLFPEQTGMSFREWRQQRRLLRALELLAGGESVTNVALEVGYENTSAFIAMFQRCLGTTPTCYLDDQDTDG